MQLYHLYFNLLVTLMALASRKARYKFCKIKHIPPGGGGNATLKNGLQALFAEIKTHSLILKLKKNIQHFYFNVILYFIINLIYKLF